MIEEIQLNGLNNEPVKTHKKHHQDQLIKIFPHVILHQFSLVPKGRAKPIH
jgi:hypothetical protein